MGAVWLGYDKTDRQHYLSSSSSETVVPIFREIMETVKPYIEQEEFIVKSVQSKKRAEEEKTTTSERSNREIERKD